MNKDKIINKDNATATNDQFICPIIPSPFDPRDHIFENILRDRRAKVANGEEAITLIRSYPETLDLSSKLLEPRNQGSRGTCLAFACAAMKEYHEKLNCEYNDYMSPDSVYFFRVNKPETGMFCRDGMEILLHKGIAPEFYFPYNGEGTDPLVVPQVALDAMSNYVISEYASIKTIEGLKEALNTHGPCVIAFPVYDSFPEIWKPSTEGEQVRGGHALAVVGYNKDGFIIRNSWGKNWNGNGMVVYKYADWGMHWEIWCCLDDLSSKIIVPPVPPPVPERSLCDKLFGCCKKQ